MNTPKLIPRVHISNALLEDIKQDEERLGRSLTIEEMKALHAKHKTQVDYVPAPMTFGAAIEALKSGKRVTRAGWNGKGMWLALQRPDAHSKMTLPYIFMSTAQNDLVPWLASQTDILAEDWSIE